jgi:hypothetical protein
VKFGRSQKSAHTGEAMARCGRCADLLPEETLTYCPACGITFSEVPVTQSYVPLADQFISNALKREKRKWAFIAFGFFMSFVASHFFITATNQERKIQSLDPLIRPLDIYVYDFENLPKLPHSVKRLAIGVALQSFEDHFHHSVQTLSYRENKLPRALEPVFGDILLKDISIQATQLSYWEQKVYPELSKTWAKDRLAPLPIIITNLPLFVDESASAQIETRHLGKGKLISGLGHPAFVLVSTYRLHPDNSHATTDMPPVKNDLERARFLGEYIIAHELGHALVGLPDTVESFALPETAIRGPASQKIFKPESNFVAKNCLMHTDAGGGFRAWDNLKKRELGSQSSCEAYEKTIQAIGLREEAVRLLKQGLKSEAKMLHEKAIPLFEEASAGWLTQLVQKEHFLFTSSLTYWWSQFFMVE